MALSFPENQKQAARYVREAIPMMVGKNIAPNPLNFTLWYAYVSNRDSELKKDLDETIQLFGTCPDNISENLFRRYVISDEIAEQQSIDESLDGLINDLLGDVDNTRLSTAHSKKQFREHLVTLETAENPDQFKKTTQDIIELTDGTSGLLSSFESQLQIAESEIQLLKERLANSEREALLDPLTKVGNRRAFEQSLYALSDQELPAISLIFADLDHFKQINDRFGHPVGDKILQATGKLITKSIPENAQAFRYGGEEFVILLHDDVSTAKLLAEKLRVLLTKLNLKNKKSNELVNGVAASFGVAEKKAGEFTEELIDRADQALYQAKNAGRNIVVTADQ